MLESTALNAMLEESKTLPILEMEANMDLFLRILYGEREKFDNGKDLAQVPLFFFWCDAD
jgi:hypothetical protein